MTDRLTDRQIANSVNGADLKTIHSLASEALESRAALAAKDAEIERLTEDLPNGIKINVIRKGYGWALTVDGEVLALVAGDQGYEYTGIKIEPEHLEASKTAVAAAEARAIAAAAQVEALRDALDTLVMACELPGDHCEIDHALVYARAALGEKP